jgi:hypothetical protein
MLHLPEFQSCLNAVMVCGFWLFTAGMVVSFLKAFAK